MDLNEIPLAEKKLELLIQYLDKQMDDKMLWSLSTNVEANYIRSELRRLVWMIEEATPEDIELQINLYDESL